MKSLSILLLSCVPVAMAGCSGTHMLSQAHQAEGQTVENVGSGTSVSRSPSSIGLDEFLGMLSRVDEQVLAQQLETRIADQSLRGARAVYEPEFYIRIDRDRKLRPTTAEEGVRNNTAGTDNLFNDYSSNDTSVRMGLSFREMTGAEIDLFYETARLTNSLQQQADNFSPEYTGSLGVAIKQPLLRNAGREVTEAMMRLASVEKDIAQETYRLTLAQRVFEGIRAYILVQRAQERVVLRERAVGLAEKLTSEIAKQRGSGLRSSSDLAEATAALGLRKSQLAQGRQELEEQLGAFQIFFGGAGASNGQRWLPRDALRPPSERLTVRASPAYAKDAFERRSEARVNGLLIEIEKINTSVAENQAKPELNLNVEYSRESLNATRQPLSRYLQSPTPYASWRVGLEYRRGIGGDIRRQAELSTSELRLQQAELTRNATLQRIESELAGIRSIVDRSNEQMLQQRGIVQEQRALLDTEKQRMASGQSSLIEVLAREVDLVVAQEALVDAVAQLNMSSYLASQISGTLLSRVGLE